MAGGKYNGAYTGAQIDKAIGKALNGTLMDAESYDPQGKKTDIFKYVDEHSVNIPITSEPSEDDTIWIDPNEGGTGGGGGGASIHQGPEPPTDGSALWYDTDDNGGKFYTAAEVDELLKSRVDVSDIVLQSLNGNLVRESNTLVVKYPNGQVTFNARWSSLSASVSNWGVLATLPDSLRPQENQEFVAFYCKSGSYGMTPIRICFSKDGSIYLMTENAVSWGTGASVFLTTTYQAANTEVQ